MPKMKTPVAPEATNGEVRTTKKAEGGLIIIPSIRIQVIEAKIIGTSPLVCSAFPDKLKQQMKEARSTDQSTSEGLGAKKKRALKPKRDFDDEFKNSLYPLDDGGYGFPAIAFKRAIVGACRAVSNLDMTMANRIIFVHGTHVSKGFNCVKINGSKPRMREDVVRLAGMDKPPDIRYRGEFSPWSAMLRIEFNGSIISRDGVLSLINYAGWSEGIGEMRPSAPKKSNDFGRFRLAEGGDS